MKLKFLYCLVFGVCIFTVNAQIRFLPCSAAEGAVSPQMSISALQKSSHSKQDEHDHHVNLTGVVLGSLCIAGGGLLYYEGQMQGDAVYHKYEKSAFTDNTDRLRRKMSLYNAMRIGGGVLAASGLLALVISF